MSENVAFELCELQRIFCSCASCEYAQSHPYSDLNSIWFRDATCDSSVSDWLLVVKIDPSLSCDNVASVVSSLKSIMFTIQKQTKNLFNTIEFLH